MSARLAYRAIPRGLAGLAVGATALFWAAAIALPLLALLARVSAGEAASAFFDSRVLSVAGVTFAQAWFSTLLSGAIGLPLGLWVGARRSRWAEILLQLPMGVPTVVAALAWVGWLGRSGVLARFGIPLDWAYSFQAVILAHVFFNAPWVAYLVSQARRQVPEVFLEASATLGASRLGIFRFILFPEVKWSFFSALCQVQAFCAMSFALVLLLGGGPPVETLETALYSRVRTGSLDLSGAIACASWEILITLTPWLLLSWMRSRHPLPRREASTRLASAGDRLKQAGPISFALLFLIPYSWVWARNGLGSLIVHENVREALFRSIRTSFLLAGATGVGTLALSVLAVIGLHTFRRSRWQPLLLGMLALPSGLSALVIGLGFWLAYGRWIDPFEGSWTAIIALQITLFFPLALRMLWPMAQSEASRALEAAWTLGASPFFAFRIVEWPRWRGPVLGCLAMVLGASLGEVAAVSLFYNENLIPMPLLISRWMAQYRFDEAQAVAGLLLVLTTASILAVAWGQKEGRLR